MNVTVTNEVDTTTVVQPGLTAAVTLGQPGATVAVEQSPLVVANIQQPSVNVLVVSGPRGPIGPPGSGVSNLTGQYPIFYDAGSGIIGITSGYYVTFPDLNSASGALVAQISAANAGVSSLNGLSGLLTLAAINPLFVSIQGQTLYISGSGLATSGDINGLNASISSMSGYTNALVAASGGAAWDAGQNNALNLSGAIQSTGASLYALITGNTGTANLSGYITTGQADLRYYPLSSNPSGYLTTGQSGQFYPASNPNQYATSGDVTSTGSTLYFLTTGVSGALQTQISALPTSTQLAQTGSILYNLVTGLSGQSVLDYATKTQLTQTGVTLGSKVDSLSGYVDTQDYNTGRQAILYTSGVSGGLEARIAGSGQAAWISSNGAAFDLSGALTLTGKILQERIVALSGFATGISGALQTQISALPTVANLQSTGQQLYLLVTGLSGQSVVDYAAKTQLTQTGVTLGSKIDALSGYVDNQDYATGRAAVLYASGLSGVLNAYIVATGNAAVAHANGIGSVLSGNLTQSGSNLYRLVTGLSGQSSLDYATKTQLTTTGATLNLRITSLSGFTTGASGALDTRIRATGNAAVTHANGIGTNLSGNLTATGDSLYRLVTGLSGQAVSTYATISNLQSTGQQAWNAANNNGINLSGNLTLTGSNLLGQINNLSAGTASQTWQLDTGASGVILKNTVSGLMLRNYLDTATADLVVYNLTVQGTQTINNSNNLAVTNQYIYLNVSGVAQNAGIEVFRSGMTSASLLWDESNMVWKAGLSGIENQIILSTDTGQFAAKTQLTTTGQTLYTMVTGLSGQAVSTYATQTQLTQTGADLILRENGISGGLEVRIVATGNAATIHANGIGVNLSGNLAQTGSSLYQIITGLSGQGVTDYATNTNLTATGQTLYGLTIGGDSNLSGNMTLTGQTLQGRITSLSGFVTGISGALQTLIDNAASDVHSVNGQSGALIVAGTGGLTISSGGAGLILISGDQSISGALTLTGQTLQGRITALSGFVGQVSGGLEIRIFQTGNAAIVHANSIGSVISGNLTQTGVTLWNRDASISGGLEQRIFLTGAAAILYASGASGALQAQIGSFATTTQLYQTGSNLYNMMTGLSGQAATDYATKTQLTTTGQTLRALTLGGDTNLSGNLTLTGQTLQSRITSLSGFVGNVSGELEVRLAQTGSAAVTHANGIGTILSGNLTLTGQTLRNNIIGLSGVVNNVFAGQNLVYQTGQQNISGVKFFVSGNYETQKTLTTSYSVLPNDSRLYCDNTNPITLTFGSAITNSGQLVKMKIINTGSVYLTGTAGQLFDGSPSYVTVGQYNTYEIHSNGANWYIW